MPPPQAHDRAFAALGDDLRPEDAACLASEADVIGIAAGETLAAAGTVDPALHAVLEGELAVLLPAGDRTLELRELVAGDVFGEDAFLDGGSTPASIVARTPARLLRLDRARYDERIGAVAGPVAGRLHLAMARTMAARLHAASCVRLENVDDDPEIEVISCLECLAGPRRGALPAFSSVSLSAYQHGTLAADAAARAHGVALAARILQPLGNELYYGLGERMDIRTFGDGTEVVRAGSVADGLYLVLDGAVAVLSAGEGPLRSAARLEAGRVFGQVAFLLQTTRTATCRAEGTTTLGIVGAHAIHGLLRYADQGRAAGTAGLEWIARETVKDWRRLIDGLRAAVIAAA